MHRVTAKAASRPYLTPEAEMRRWLTLSRRELFKFKTNEFDTGVEIEGRALPLEVHPIGRFVPSEVPFNEALLETLCCPLTGGDLRLDAGLNALVSDRAQMAFPISRAGIPILLMQWAVPWPSNKV